MNLFDRAMESVGKPALRAAFGHDAAFTPKATGTPVDTWAMPATDLGLAGQFGERAETLRRVELPASDVPEPQPGDTVTFGGRTYRIDQLVDRDEYFYTVAIR